VLEEKQKTEAVATIVLALELLIAEVVFQFNSADACHLSL